MTSNRRNIFILLVVLGLLAGSLAVITSKPTRLGLDLEGGVELVYQGQPTPQQPQVTAEAIDRAIDIMRQRVDQLGVAEPEIQRAGPNQIVVGLPNVKNAKRAIDQVGQTAQLFFYDWEANVLGSNLKPDPTNPQVAEQSIPSQYEAIKRAARRPKQNNHQASSTGQFYLVNNKTKQVVQGPVEQRADLFEDPNQKLTPGQQVLEVKQGTLVIQAEQPTTSPQSALFNQWFVLNDNPSLNGNDIKGASQQLDQSAGGLGRPVVSLDFTKQGGGLFRDVTRQLAERGVEQQIPGSPPAQSFQHFAVVLDNKIITRPVIDFQQLPDGIAGGKAQIEGNFTVQNAQDLARLIRIGALPVKLQLISQSQVSATLGKQALHEGLVAGLVGLGIVMLFLLLFYRVLGVIAAGALIIYALYFFALIKLIPITLTLPGIAGLILTIGVAADANIVIFERVKEEVRAGRSILAAIPAGYKKGLTAIIDANVVTIMTAFILFVLATAGVKGFAFTLGIGTLVSLFTAVLATSAILGLLSHVKFISKPAMLGAGKRHFTWKLNFVGASKWFFSMSGVILLIGALAIGGRGVHLGIDFKSGTRMTVGLQKQASEAQVSTLLSKFGLGQADIQQIKQSGQIGSTFQISTANLGPNQVQEVRAGFEKTFGVTTFDNTSIGPTFGQSVARSALIAVIASLILISLYIALRFEWKFAVPVMIALAHDVLITAGVYSLTGREVSAATVAALLTILGYSLYDTIIVFDRVRENIPRMPRAAFAQVVNRSVSEVITRSMATSLSTLLPILALLLFGGETLRDFAFALMVGVISGAYSSIFIAAPVLVHWKEREPLYRRRNKLIRAHFQGVIPAFAGEMGDFAVQLPEVPAKKSTTRRRRTDRITAPEQPETVSDEEFQELVQDIEIEQEQTPTERKRAQKAKSDAERQAKRERRKERRDKGKRRKHGR